MTDLVMAGDKAGQKVCEFWLVGQVVFFDPQESCRARSASGKTVKGSEYRCPKRKIG
ncbi:hypothetical protein [Allorhizobium taibaishanense]|uniref:hypothetical protein n=1 Tax=Allorhizobium taibaishanense TaxID=887144 RepID=UPI0013C2D507|nr:hypothetical protein [Allorhizobium taibaishanense]